MQRLLFHSGYVEPPSAAAARRTKLPTPVATRGTHENLVRMTAPRLLGGLSPDGEAVDLRTHRAAYAEPPISRRGRGDAAIIDAVEAAGLRGRGGAGFPTARKMRTVAGAARPPVVLANGTEGEPASGKDAVLLSRLPHLVIDGALWAAAAVGADRVVIAVDRSNGVAAEAVAHALAERERHEPSAVAIEVSWTPPRYVAGEESALVQFVNKGVAKPTVGAGRPFQRGIDGRPTLVQNVETLAHVAQIAAWGPDWFRLDGTAGEAGTALYTVTGAVTRPGIVEAPMGATTMEILAMAGGPSVPLQAALVGGFFGAWVPTEALWRSHTRAGLEPYGASPGCGVIVALPAGACGLSETARLVAWYSAQSAGQCGPCVHGLADLAAGCTDLAHGGGPGLVEQLRRWGSMIEGRGGCHHPDGAVRLLRSAFAVFADDVAAHSAGRPCRASASVPFIYVPDAAHGWR